MSVVGTDIGSSTLKVAELCSSSNRITLRRCAVAALDGRKPLEALKRLIASKGIEAQEAAVGVSSPELIVKPFKFPSMPKKELSKAIRMEAEQDVLNGYPFNDMTIAWHMLPSFANDTCRGLLAAVPKSVVSNRIELVQAAGLKPIVVDVEALALWNAYWTLSGRKDSLKTVLLANIGDETTHVAIVRSPDDLILVREFPMGSGSLQGEELSEWLTDMKDSFSYARSEKGLRALDAAYVTGRQVDPPLLDLLSSVLNCTAKTWNPLDYLPSENPIGVEKSNGPLFAIAIGLALRGLS